MEPVMTPTLSKGEVMAAHLSVPLGSEALVSEELKCFYGSSPALQLPTPEKQLIIVLPK
jgi:hypothetical protein